MEEIFIGEDEDVVDYDCDCDPGYCDCDDIFEDEDEGECEAKDKNEILLDKLYSALKDQLFLLYEERKIGRRKKRLYSNRNKYGGKTLRIVNKLNILAQTPNTCSDEERAVVEEKYRKLHKVYEDSKNHFNKIVEEIKNLVTAETKMKPKLKKAQEKIDKVIKIIEEKKECWGIKYREEYAEILGQYEYLNGAMREYSNIIKLIKKHPDDEKEKDFLISDIYYKMFKLEEFYAAKPYYIYKAYEYIEKYRKKVAAVKKVDNTTLKKYTEIAEKAFIECGVEKIFKDAVLGYRELIRRNLHSIKMRRNFSQFLFDEEKYESAFNYIASAIKLSEVQKQCETKDFLETLDLCIGICAESGKEELAKHYCKKYNELKKRLGQKQVKSGKNPLPIQGGRTKDKPFSSSAPPIMDKTKERSERMPFRQLNQNSPRVTGKKRKGRKEDYATRKKLRTNEEDRQNFVKVERIISTTKTNAYEDFTTGRSSR